MKGDIQSVKAFMNQFHFLLLLITSVYFWRGVLQDPPLTELFRWFVFSSLFVGALRAGEAFRGFEGGAKGCRLRHSPSQPQITKSADKAG